MACSLNQTPSSPSTFLPHPRPLNRPLSSSASSPPPIRRHPRLSLNSHHLSPLNFFEPRPAFRCFAAPSPVQQKILDFCLCTHPVPDGVFAECFRAVNAISFNYLACSYLCKHMLNLFPFPWLLSGIYFAGGFLVAAFQWYSGNRKLPSTRFKFWKPLFPVAIAHTIGHVATIISLSNSSTSFTEIMRCGEPMFTLFLSSCFGLEDETETLPLAVYLSLLPIIGGCALAALTEPNFNLTGFISAMIANFAFASMNIISKRMIKENDKKKKKKKKAKEIRGSNYGACLSILSLLILAPFALAMEGPRLWAAGWENASFSVSQNMMILLVLVQGFVCGIYVEASYSLFPLIDDFSFISVSAMKKIILIGFFVTFINPLNPMNALAAAMTILGFALHSRELCKVSRAQILFL